MIYTRHPDGTVTAQRESWVEWVRAERHQGERYPKFFLPVKRDYHSGVMICWIFPLAPFVLFGALVAAASRSVWGDLLEVLFALMKAKK